MRAWLSPWPPPGYLPTGRVTGHFPELAPLHDWWWKWLHGTHTGALHGYRTHPCGVDVLYVPDPFDCGLCRMDADANVWLRAGGSLEGLVALASTSRSGTTLVSMVHSRRQFLGDPATREDR